jgi:hypothetical protein
VQIGPFDPEGRDDVVARDALVDAVVDEHRMPRIVFAAHRHPSADVFACGDERSRKPRRRRCRQRVDASLRRDLLFGTA